MRYSGSSEAISQHNCQVVLLVLFLEAKESPGAPHRIDALNPAPFVFKCISHNIPALSWQLSVRRGALRVDLKSLENCQSIGLAISADPIPPIPPTRKIAR